MAADLASRIEAKVRRALAAQPFRGAPHFDDVVAAAVAAAAHVVEEAGGGAVDALVTKVAALEARLLATQSELDEVVADLRAKNTPASPPPPSDDASAGMAAAPSTGANQGTQEA